MSEPYYSDAALAKQAEMDRKVAAGEPITTDDLLGCLQPRDPRQFRYGACPQQVEGVDRRGRPFYFRERHGEWTLDVGEAGWGAYRDWPNDGTAVAEGDGDPDCDEIDRLISLHLGDGWVAVP